MNREMITNLFSDIEEVKSALEKIKSTIWDMNSYGNPFASFQTVDTYFSRADDSVYTPEYFLPSGGATPLERFAFLRHGFGIWIHNLTSHPIILEHEGKPFIEIPYMDVKEILIFDKVEILYNSGVKVPFEEGENTVYVVPDSVYWELKKKGIKGKGITPEGAFIGIMEIDNILIVNATSHPVDFIDAPPDSIDSLEPFSSEVTSLSKFFTIHGKWIDTESEFSDKYFKLLKRRLEINENNIREFFKKFKDTLATYSHFTAKRVFIVVSLPVLLGATKLIKEIGKEYIDIDVEIEVVGVIMATKREVRKKAACLRYFSIAP